MKRALLVLAMTAAAGAGAYGQTVLRPEKPSADPIQVGVTYAASFCGGTGSFGVHFDMRVTKILNDHWFEADYGYFNKNTGDFGYPPETGRFNQAVLCYVKPILP